LLLLYIFLCDVVPLFGHSVPPPLNHTIEQQFHYFIFFAYIGLHTICDSWLSNFSDQVESCETSLLVIMM
jgi:hypothetical protein